jgi:hypothetical protein
MPFNEKLLHTIKTKQQTDKRVSDALTEHIPALRQLSDTQRLTLVSKTLNPAMVGGLSNLFGDGKPNEFAFRVENEVDEISGHVEFRREASSLADGEAAACRKRIKDEIETGVRYHVRKAFEVWCAQEAKKFGSDAKHLCKNIARKLSKVYLDARIDKSVDSLSVRF